MPKCIAIEWGRNTPCKNEATHLPYNGTDQFCDAHFKNLQLADQNKSKSGVGVKRKDNNVVEVCLDGSPEQNRVIECDQLVQTYRPGSPRPMSPRAPSPRPGSPYIYGNSPKVSSPAISTLQYYSQKPQSPRLLYQNPQPQVVYQNPQPQVIYQTPQVQVGQPRPETGPFIYKSYNDNILDNLLQKKPGCNDLETGHECEEDEEDRFVSGRDPRKKRMIRSAPDVERNCNPPFIDFKHNEHIVECLEILDRSKDVKEGLDCINDIMNIVEKHPKNKSYNYNVTEVVVDKVAAQLARYMFDADRIELLLTFMFDYESRDLTQKMSFYGFKKDYSLTGVGKPTKFLDKSPLQFLEGKSCEYFAVPRPVPAIRANMYKSYATQDMEANKAKSQTDSPRGDDRRGSTLTVEQLKELKEQIEDETKRESKDLIDNINTDIKKLERGQSARNTYDYYKAQVDKVNKLPGNSQASGRQTVTPPLGTSSPVKPPSQIGRKELLKSIENNKDEISKALVSLLTNTLYFDQTKNTNINVYDINKLPLNKLKNIIGLSATSSSIDNDYKKAVKNAVIKGDFTNFNDDGTLPTPP